MHKVKEAILLCFVFSSHNTCATPPQGVCAINGLLYVIGGDDGSCNLSSVEFYNPATDKWSLIPTNMSNGRSYAGTFPLSLLSRGPNHISPVYGADSLPLPPTGVAVIDKPLWSEASPASGSTETQPADGGAAPEMSCVKWTGRPPSTRFPSARSWRLRTLLHWTEGVEELGVGGRFLGAEHITSGCISCHKTQSDPDVREADWRSCSSCGSSAL